MVIGIMGGTFDPVHNGHLQMAHAAQTQLGCDRVLWIPTGLPPHKNTAVSNEDRLAMLRLATDGLSGHAIDLCEYRREGYSRTVDTLRELHDRYPNDSFVFIIGADTVLQLEHWKDFATVSTLCSFGVAVRPTVADSRLEEQLAYLKKTYQTEFLRMDFPHIPLSSSGIREARAKGQDISEQVPKAVYAYILEHNLYKERME
jgi:nicotinate-nucleotide adenylyltransferase